MKYLVRIETPSVKKYVFATNQLKEIRGASALLEKLNQEECEKLAKKCNGLIFYLGGGSGLICFENQEQAKIFKAQLEKLYFERTGMSLVQVVGIDYDDNEEIGVQREWLNNKLGNTPPLQPYEQLLSTVKVVCNSCHRYPALDVRSYEGEEKKRICGICKKKIDVMREKSDLYYTQGFTAYISKKKKQIVSWEPPQSFLEIGNACRNRNGYIGLIYADGNQMGRVLDLIDSEKRGTNNLAEIADAYNHFSKLLNQTLQNAVYEALYVTLSEEFIFERKSQVTSEILFQGGDDLLFACPADQALSIGIEIAKNFENNPEMRQHGMSLSLGILIAQSHLPIHTMLHQAEQLLKSAKKRSFWLEKNANELKGAIDFAVVTASTARELEYVRKEEWELDTDQDTQTKLTARPYSIEELENLLSWIRRLKTNEISVGRLSQLETACRVSKAQGNLAWYSLLGRMHPQQRKVMSEVLRAFGANKEDNPLWTRRKGEGKEFDYTVINDILEIYPFLAK